MAHFRAVLRIPGISWLQVRSSILTVAVCERNSFHSLAVAPTLYTQVVGRYSSTRSRDIPLQSSPHECTLDHSPSQSNVSDAFQLARGFSTSTHCCAKELSEKGEVVYTGAISGMIKGVKIFSLSTSVIGICLQPMLLFSNQELPTGLKFAIGGFINFFVFMNPFIIHYIAKKYVTQLCWNRRSGVFTATTWSFFLQRRELQFTAEDVKVPDVPGMFTFLEAKGTPLFLDPHAFEDSEAYVHLMGYNKPLEWELPQRGEQPSSERSQKT